MALTTESEVTKKHFNWTPMRSVKHMLEKCWSHFK